MFASKQMKWCYENTKRATNAVKWDADVMLMMCDIITQDCWGEIGVMATSAYTVAVAEARAVSVDWQDYYA